MLRGNGSTKSLEHGRVGSLVHAQDKMFFAQRGPATVKVAVSPGVLPVGSRKYQGMELGAYFPIVGDPEVSVDGDCTEKLKKWKSDLPEVRRKSGKDWAVDKVDPVERDTFTLPWYLTDLLARGFEEKDYLELLGDLVNDYQVATGRRVKAANWHFDTDHFHVDLWTTTVNELDVVPATNRRNSFVKKELGSQCWRVGPSVAINMRHAAFGLRDVDTTFLDCNALRAKKAGYDHEDMAVVAVDAFVGSRLDRRIVEMAQDRGLGKQFDFNLAVERSSKFHDMDAKSFQLVAQENVQLRKEVSDLKLQLADERERRASLEFRLEDVTKRLQRLEASKDR